MTGPKITISPGTKVGQLLDAYPELEAVLIAMSPTFEKLKNPLLRKTVARVATLQQVSVVGGVNIDVLIRRLRKEAGQNYDDMSAENPEYLSADIPEWLDYSKVKIHFDATAIITSGESPMKEILHQTGLLNSGEIFELQTPFIPAPIIDILKSKKFKTHTIVNNDSVLTYICK